MFFLFHLLLGGVKEPKSTKLLCVIKRIFAKKYYPFCWPWIVETADSLVCEKNVLR